MFTFVYRVSQKWCVISRIGVDLEKIMSQIPIKKFLRGNVTKIFTLEIEC